MNADNDAVAWQMRSNYIADKTPGWWNPISQRHFDALHKEWGGDSQEKSGWRDEIRALYAAPASPSAAVVDWRTVVDKVANNIGERLSHGCDQSAVDDIGKYIDELFALVKSPSAAYSAAWCRNAANAELAADCEIAAGASPSAARLCQLNDMQPCPKCGCPNGIELDSSSAAEASWIECHNCQHRMQAKCDEETLIERWNKLCRENMPFYDASECDDVPPGSLNSPREVPAREASLRRSLDYWHGRAKAAEAKLIPASPSAPYHEGLIAALSDYKQGDESGEMCLVTRQGVDEAIAILKEIYEPSASPSAATDPLTLALRFHEEYERLAPQFGYETRTETRQFDPESPNGRLMVAVCAALMTPSAAVVPEGWHVGKDSFGYLFIRGPNGEVDGWHEGTTTHRFLTALIAGAAPQPAVSPRAVAPEGLIDTLRKRYEPSVIPPCRVCGGKLSIGSIGGGEPTRWACSGMTDDPDVVRYKPGRTLADDHYSESEWVDRRQGGDEDVIALIDALAGATP